METYFWVILALIGLGLYAAFGQHRNKLRFDVESVTREGDSAFADGVVRDGWIGLSQHVFFRGKTGVRSAHVIAMLSGETHLCVAKKGQRIRLVITGKCLEELGCGSLLATAKRDV